VIPPYAKPGGRNNAGIQLGTNIPDRNMDVVGRVHAGRYVPGAKVLVRGPATFELPEGRAVKELDRPAIRRRQEIAVRRLCRGEARGGAGIRLDPPD
jgi:hypothetical protein